MTNSKPNKTPTFHATFFEAEVNETSSLTCTQERAALATRLWDSAGAPDGSPGRAYLAVGPDCRMVRSARWCLAGGHRGETNANTAAARRGS